MKQSARVFPTIQNLVKSRNMSSDIPTRLLASNARWAQDVSQSQPSFFPQSAKGQQPKVLWIGCADSRVPESVVMACAPGDIFVHRNIANQFSLNDQSALSVLQYAVDFVGVEHVIIAGHSGCGGAAACYEAACGNALVHAETELGQWLAPLVGLATELGASRTPEDKPAALLTLIEENVRRQVAALAASDTMRDAWAMGKEVFVHGWMYSLETGLLRDLEVSQGPKAS